MAVKTFNKFGHKYFYLGTDEQGKNYYLQSPSWDCDWYWGYGYVETFTNNSNPASARDIDSHQHFNGLFFNGRKNGFDNFKEFFTSTDLEDKDVWKLCELMKTFYIMREYSDTLSRGGAHYTSNPLADEIKNDAEYKRINEIVLPKLFDEVEKLLSK